MKNIFIYTLLFALCPLPLTAQTPDTMWTKIYGGTEDDCCWSGQQTSDGGYFLAGYTKSFGLDSFDVYVVKTDSTGDTLWTKTYGGSGNDKGIAAQQTIDGGYIIGGKTTSYGVGNVDLWLIKTNSLGDTLWTKTIGGVESEGCRALQQTSDTGYILAGWTTSFGAGSYDLYLVKTNSIGDTLWTKTYGGVDDEFGYSVEETTDGGYIVVGITRSFGSGDYDIYILKTDPVGDTMWTLVYGGALFDKGCYIQETVDSCYVMSGWTYSFGQGLIAMILMKINIDGDTLWTKFFGGSGSDAAYSVKQLPDEGFILMGSTNSYGAGLFDIYLLRTDSYGDSLWAKAIGTPHWDYGWIGQQTTDGGFMVAGYTSAPSGVDTNFYLVKTDVEQSIEEEKGEPFVKNNVSTTILNGPLLLPEGRNHKIIDIMGRIVAPEKIKPGIYFIEVDGKITRKIVKIE
jgi:hypothetical protein